MPSPTSTFGLLEQVRQGDPEAPTRLFDKYRRRLAVLIHYKLGPELRPRIEVDDVLQETMWKAFRDLDRFTYRSPGSFLRWLAAIADHVIADAARYQGRARRRARRRALRSFWREPTDSRTPSRLLRRKQELSELMRRLDQLPEEYRRVILLARFEGLTTQEVAERLGKPREAVALLLHRALKRLRELSGRT